MSTLRALTKIPVKFDISFLFLLVGIPLLTLTQSGIYPAFQALVIISLAFSLVILHEYGHAWAAIRCGLRVNSVTLWILGGLARIENLHYLPPRQEIFISISGPAVNFFLALLGCIPLLIFGSSFPVVYFIAINLILGLFNLVPAFPMDGGRILRAVLHWIYRDYVSATRITAKTGIFLGSILGATSFLLGFFLVGIIFIFVVYSCYSILKTENYCV